MPTTWKLPAHTAVKHLLLQRYLDAWFPILGTRHNRLIYIDGFAGPGSYAGGEKGSPILAIESALGHLKKGTVRKETKVLFLFVERDYERASHLESTIQAMKLPKTFETYVERSDFHSVFVQFLDPSGLGSSQLAPTFALIDPFGFSGIPMDTMTSLLSNPRCELLINLMVEPINRFLNHPNASVRSHIAMTFGTDDVNRIVKSTGDRIEALLTLYRRQLSTAGKYIGRFDMKPRRNTPNYSLFFASNHPLGFEKMKEAMWRTDQKSGSEYRGGNSMTDMYDLFGHEDLEDAIFDKFSDTTVPFNDVADFVIEETAYLPKHLRSVLQRLETSGRLIVSMSDGGKRRGQTYPKDRTELSFVAC